MATRVEKAIVPGKITRAKLLSSGLADGLSNLKVEIMTPGLRQYRSLRVIYW